MYYSLVPTGHTTNPGINFQPAVVIQGHGQEFGEGAELKKPLGSRDSSLLLDR